MNDTDQQLADKIVALGVGAFVPITDQSAGYYFIGDGRAHTATGFVEDGRVAVAMMERVDEISINQSLSGSFLVEAWVDRDGGRQYFDAEGPDLPRAINEACAAALERKLMKEGAA